jgi:hypothetical protein
MTVQDLIVLESDGRKLDVSTRSAERWQETSLDDQGEHDGCTVVTKVLC